MELLKSFWDGFVRFMRDFEPCDECPKCGYLIDPVDGCRCEDDEVQS
jgi:hypothetical protein